MMKYKSVDQSDRVVELRNYSLDSFGRAVVTYGEYGNDRSFEMPANEFFNRFTEIKQMVHFNFTVSDTDAENIFDIMRSAITRNSVKMLKAIQQGDNDSILFLERDTAYIESLIAKMHNTRVENVEQNETT